MIRPYICVGATMIISLLVFCQQGFWCAVAICAVALCCSALFFFLRNKNNILNTVFICFLSLLISSSLFITKTAADYRPAMLLVSDETRTVTGNLCEYAEDYGKYYYTIDNVSVNGRQIKYKIRISTEIYKNAEIDDILTFTDATIYELGASAGNQSFYKANGIYLGAYTDNDYLITSAEKHSVNYYLDQIRQYISFTLGINLSSQYSAVADAMLTGNTTEIDDEILLNFRYSGISHLFAVSGFHLSLWSTSLYVFLNRIFTKKKYISNIICILFVIFFMALTGFTKSVVRAGIMLLILLFGRIIKYQSDPINSLFIAVTVILILNPFAVMSVSLQMSFLATLGILILTDPVTKPIYKLEKIVRSKFVFKIFSTAYITICVSLIASLFTLPVSALTFGYVSVAAPLTNLLCIFPSQAVMLISGISVLTSGIPFIAKPLAFVLTVLIRYILIVTDKIASMNHAVLDASSVFVRIILIAVVSLMAVFLIIYRKNETKLRYTLFCSAAAVAIVALCTVSVQSSSVKITVADVGNGTSVILNTGQRSAIIGCGGSSYKDYKLTDCADLEADMQYDLLLIPRNTDTESSYAYTLLSRYNFDNCIISDDEYPDYITELLPENTVFTDNCTVKLDEKTTLVYINNNELSGVRIKSENFTCTILFKATSDIPEEWQSGSLLITRQSLPAFDLSGFENIIVSSSKEIIYDNENIYTTRFCGQTDYRIYSSGAVTVREEKHDYQ